MGHLKVSPRDACCLDQTRWENTVKKLIEQEWEQKRSPEGVRQTPSDAPEASGGSHADSGKRLIGQEGEHWYSMLMFNMVDSETK